MTKLRLTNKLHLLLGLLLTAFILGLASPESSCSASHWWNHNPPVSRVLGSWDATVTVGSAQVPFRFQIVQQANVIVGEFFEGDKPIPSSSGTWEKGRLQFDYEFLNSTLTATLNHGTLDGTYRFNRKSGHIYPFHAQRAASADAAPQSSAFPQIAGHWEMKPVGPDNNSSKNSQDNLSLHLYLRQSGADVSGSILRVDGDTGTLVGGWRGGSLVLSHFAGERAILVIGKLQPNGTLVLLLNNQSRYLAARTDHAVAAGIPAPPDPFRFTTVAHRDRPFHFSFPDVNGNIVTDAQFKGKVVVLAIGGTWCPNCRDEAPFLVNLYDKFHRQGLDVIGLEFEAAGTFAEDKSGIESFVREFSIPYTILYGGGVGDVKKQFPQLVNFGAYPTTIFLGRDGRVAAVHAGFASAATGKAHDELREEVDTLVEQLLEARPGSMVSD